MARVTQASLIGIQNEIQVQSPLSVEIVKTPTEPEFVEFLITGHPRSGTTYMSKLFKSFGFDIGHEDFGKDGISSWSCAVKNENVKHGIIAKGWTKHMKMIQVVRDPWLVISSMVTNGMAINSDGPMTKFMKDYIYIDENERLMTRATQMVIGWNKIINNQSPDLVVKVEESIKIIPDWLCSNGYEIKYGEVPSSDINTGKNSYKLAKDQIYLLPEEWICKLESHANYYGYELF